MVKMSDITSVGRSIDPRYPTNRAIAIVTILVMIGGVLHRRLSSEGWGESIFWGVNAGLSVFLTWALCRELAPDHPLAAFVAAGLALVGLSLWGLPRLAVILWLIVVMRVVNRTTGLPAGVLDALGLLGMAGWLSLQGNWGYGVITALAFFLDSLLPDRARRQLVFALLAVVVTAVTAILAGAPPVQGAPSLLGGFIALALSLLFSPVALAARSVKSVGDETGEPLTPIRVQAAQALALLAGIETASLGGIAAIARLNPLWAAALGASLHYLYRALKP